MLEYNELKNMSIDDIAERMIEEKLTQDSFLSSHVKHFKPLNAKRMYNLLKQCCKSINYELNYENTYVLLNDNRVILILATAGSGKTTTICIKLLREILLKGRNPNRVCVLSFNKASVRDLKRKLRKTMEGFNLVCRRFGIFLDDTELPIIRSLNSLTYNIVDQFRDVFGIGQLSIITDEESSNLMSQVLNSKAKDMNYVFTPSDEMCSNMLSLFDLLNETLDDISKYEKTSLINGSGLTLQIAKEVLQSYRNLLNIQGKLSHSDTCRIILEACERDVEFKKTLQGFYELIIMDEVQDVSESTFRLLKLLASEENSLWAVGDGDQSIYKFKGSRPNNCQLFGKDFKDAITCNLSLNRRCRENILTMASTALTSMTDRVGILPRASKEGGEVFHKQYTNKLEVIEEIGVKLKSVSKEELSNYAIGYRKNFSAFYIVNTLLELGIPFQIKDDFQPGNDLLSRSLNGIMSLLKSPSNKGFIANNVYRITGVSKKPPVDMVNKVLCKNYKDKDLNDISIIESYFDEVMDEEDCDYFYEIPLKYFKLKGKNSAERVEEEFNKLEKLCKKLKKQTPLKDIVPDVMELFNNNFWGYMKKKKNFSQEFEDMIVSDWSRDMSYVAYKHMKAKQEDDIKQYTSAGMGVQLSTMHTLKGLEFDTMFCIELENEVMPLIREANSLSPEEIEDCLNEELRLLYVAMTRAKNNLYMYWSSTQVSSFYPLVNDYYELMKQTTKADMYTVSEEDEFALPSELSISSDDEVGFNYDINLSIDNIQNAINLDIDKFEEDDSLTDLAIDINVDTNIDTTDTDISLDIVSEIDEESPIDLTLDISNPVSLDITLDEISSDDLDLSLDSLVMSDIHSENSTDTNIELDIPSDLTLDIPQINSDTRINSSQLLEDESSRLMNPSVDSTQNHNNTPEEQSNSVIKNTVKDITKRALAGVDKSIPEYKSDSNDIDEDDYSDFLHPDEDFVELKEGQALQSVLKIICREIEIS